MIVLKPWSLPVTRSFCCLICSFSNRCCKRAWWLLFGFPSKATWGWVEDGGTFPPYCPAKATPCLSDWVSPFCFSLNDDEACQRTTALVTAFHGPGHLYLRLVRWSSVILYEYTEKKRLTSLSYTVTVRRKGRKNMPVKCNTVRNWVMNPLKKKNSSKSQSIRNY